MQEKGLHGKVPKSITDLADSISWQWLRSEYVKKYTKAFIPAAHDQALKTNWIKANIDRIDCFPLYRLPCTSMHIASGCKQLAKWR